LLDGLFSFFSIAWQPLSLSYCFRLREIAGTNSRRAGFWCMAALRIIGAGIALSLTLAVAADATAQSSQPDEGKRNVRVIDMSAANAVTSDHTKWHSRAIKPPVEKNTAKAETARTEAPPEKPAKKKVVRRAAPSQNAYAAYASEPVRERSGFGLFNW
jgi:hypothetical protein